MGKGIKTDEGRECMHLDCSSRCYQRRSFACFYFRLACIFVCRITASFTFVICLLPQGGVVGFRGHG